MSSSPKSPNKEMCDEEWKELISNLPKEKTFTVYPLYQYEGFWYRDKYLAGAISCQKHFEAQDSDVFVVSSPKCGTTWLKAITFALLNRKRFPADAKNHPLLAYGPHDLVPFLEMNMNLAAAAIKPQIDMRRLFATHIPHVSLPDSIKKGSSQLVYLCRNPKDTFVSMWHFMIKLGLLDKETSSIEEAFEYFCKGLSVFGPFWDHVLQYWNRSLEDPKRVMFLKYEDVKAQPDVVLRRLTEFLGCPFSPDEDRSGLLRLCSFDHLSRLHVNETGESTLGVQNSAFFRRGEVGDWTNYLSVAMVHKIDRITKLKFSGLGLDL